MRTRAICVCRDEGVRNSVAEVLARRGVTVEHHDAVPAELGDAAMIVVDRATRRHVGDRLRDANAPIVIVGDDLDDDALISLMIEPPISHLVCDPADRELGITSDKLASGDLFGLEKYLGAGVRVSERVVASDAEKRRAIDEVTAWAESVGARRPVVHRLASVVDELLMNALYDAPRESGPSVTVARAPEGARRVEPQAPARAIVRWASDERAIALSVGDDFGALRQRDLIDHVRRAREDRGRPNPPTADDRGAGLGLYLVLANVASLIVNVDPGRRTEVVCLFDLPKRDRRAIERGVRSLNVFQAC